MVTVEFHPGPVMKWRQRSLWRGIIDSCKAYGGRALLARVLVLSTTFGLLVAIMVTAGRRQASWLAIYCGGWNCLLGLCILRTTAFALGSYNENADGFEIPVARMMLLIRCNFRDPRFHFARHHFPQEGQGFSIFYQTSAQLSSSRHRQNICMF